jgi:hypothetical protein
MQYESGWSYDDQLERGVAWAKQNNHEVTATYLQPAVSAASADRDELLEIVEGAHRNEYDGLWIRDLMRFTRSPDDVQHLRVIETQYGKRLFEDGRSITLLTAEGQLDIRVRVGLGEYQVAQIRKTTSHGKQARARAGKHNFSIPPTGYAVIDDAPALREDNAPGVAMIFAKFETGLYSAREIVEMVNAAGYRTNKGHPFTTDTVISILRNKFYAGFVAYRGLVPMYTEAKRARRSKRDIEWIKGSHPALIEEATWDKCAAIRIKRAFTAPGNAALPHRIYLLAKVARCSHCGQTMRAQASKYERARYRCSSRDRALPCPAQHAYISEAKLLPQIDEMMRRLVWPDAIKQRVREIATADNQTEQIKRERKKLEQQLARVKKLYELGDYTDAEYLSRRDDITTRLKALVPAPTTDYIQQALDKINDTAVQWIGASPARRQKLLRTLFVAVRIDVDMGIIAEWTPHPELAAIFQAAGVQ